MDALNDFLSQWWLDIFTVFVFAYYAVDGYYRGLVRMSLDAAGFVLSFVVAILAYRFPAALIERSLEFPYFFASALSFFAIWCLCDLAWPAIVRRFEKGLTPVWKLTVTEKSLGALPGLVNGVVLMSVLLTTLLAFPVPEKLKAQVNASPIAAPLVSLSNAADEAVKPLLGAYGRQGIHLITVSPEPGDALELHFTVSDGRYDPDSEQKIFELVNRERREQGLEELVWDNPLRDVARLHSDDMFRQGYFAHVNKEHLTPAERADRLGVPYGMIGENLAFAPTVSVAHQGLMNSPGHRANILKTGYRKIGIGVIDGGVYGKMFTQLFSD